MVYMFKFIINLRNVTDLKNKEKSYFNVEWSKGKLSRIIIKIVTFYIEKSQRINPEAHRIDKRVQ